MQMQSSCTPTSIMLALLISILLTSHHVVSGQFIYSFEVPDESRFPGQSSMFDLSKFKIVMPSQLPKIQPQTFAASPEEAEPSITSQASPQVSAARQTTSQLLAERRQSFSSPPDGGLDSSAQNHVFLRQPLPDTQPRTQPQLFSLPTDPRQAAAPQQQQPQHVTQPIITDPRLLQQQNPSLFSQNLQGQNFQHQQLSILPRTPAPTAAASSIPSAGFSPQSQSPSQRFVSQPDQTFSPGPPPFSDASVPVFASNRVSSLGAQQQQAGQQLGSQAQGSAFQSQFLQPQAAPQAATSPQGLTPSQLAALNFFNGASTAQDFNHLRQRQAQAAQEAQIRAQQEAQARAQQEANVHAQQEAQARAQQEAAVRAQQEAQARAQQEAAVRAQQEAQARAQQEATLRAQQQEAAQRSAAEARLRQQQEANARANADAALKQQREAQAAREAAIRAQQQADAAVARYRALLQRTQEPQPQPAQPTAQPQPQPQPQQFQPSQPQDPFSGQLDFQRTSGDRQRQRQIQSTSSQPIARSPDSWNSQPQPQQQPQPQRQAIQSSPSAEAAGQSQSTSRLAKLQIGQLPADTDSDGIPGEAGKDYPILVSIPQTSFSCSRVPLSGYYADTETACQVVHFCQKGGAQDSFLCPNGTIFNQEKFSCQWWYEVNCSDAPKFYVLNDNLYKVPATTPAPLPSSPSSSSSSNSNSRSIFAASSSSSASSSKK